MPYKSLAQEGYFHTHKAELEKQGVDVDEWDKATKGKHLLKRVVDKHRKTREMSMNTPDLITLNSVLDEIINLDADDKLKDAAVLTTGAGLGVAGTLAHKAIMARGGYAGNWKDAKEAYNTGYAGGTAPEGTPPLGRAATSLGSTVGKLTGHVPSAEESAVANIGARASAALRPVKNAGMGIIDWIKSLGKGGSFIKASSRIENLVQLNELADSLIEMEGINKVAVGAGLAAGGAVGGVAGAHVYHVLQSQKRWAKTAKDNEYLKISKDLYLDKHGAVYGHNHPDLKKGKITELSDKSETTEFARGDYAIPFYKKLHKAEGMGLAERLSLRHLDKDIASSPPSKTPALLGINDYRNQMAWRIKNVKKTQPAIYRNLAGLKHMNAVLDEILEFKSPIHIKKKNRGKFDALKKRTGKTTEELEHSKNPKTRKRAVFAENFGHKK